MTSIVPAICRACDRLHGVSLPPSLDWPGGKKVKTCDAFPGGIPDSIALGGSHTEPVEGDHGLRFRQAPGQEAHEAFLEWARWRGPS
jgi:hypothetical protein